MINIVEHHPGVLKHYGWSENMLECTSENGVLLRVSVLTEDIIRFRYATEGFYYSDFSYAIDPGFRTAGVRATQSEEDDYIEVRTAKLICRVYKTNLRCEICDASGFAINKDGKGFHWENDLATGNDEVFMSKQAADEECFFGLGDKPTELNLRGKRFQNWGTDSYGYVKNTDPLYKNIPFYYGLHHGIGYGIFFDNSFRTFFDFASERVDATSFWSPGGEMNYYFIGGPDLIDVARRFSLLTGRPDMPAMWALGYQQCKWSYYPESKVKEVTSKMRELEIPCDAIYLDIDYMDGFRCFTWDKERFSHPKRMVDQLKEDGFQTVVIIDPGIKKDLDYPVFKEALDKGYFCRRPDGPYVAGIVWPGECYFPDFTKAEVRKWWAGLYRTLIAEIGVAGVWNDMNEPALFEVDTKTFQDDVRHDYDGHPCSHKKAHNVYGMQMARATYEGAKKWNTDKRSLIITRSGYAGLQRFSSIWTGDNCSTWEHIWLANVQCQRMAISGISFAGSDVGGFIGRPSEELFVRWIQLGIFHPFCRVHSSQDDGDQEPWSFGEEVLKLFKEAVELRYRMLPYHYTAFYQAHKNGTPVLRPLAFYDQTDPETYDRNSEFLCGDHLLTCSVDHPDLKSVPVYLPRGRWYNYWDHVPAKGGRTIDFQLTMDTFPLFVKAGAVIPLYPVQQWVGQIAISEITLRVYYRQGTETSLWYEDAHDGYDYESGDHRLAAYETDGDLDKLTITQDVMGSYQPGISSCRLELIGLPFKVRSIEVDGMVWPAGDLAFPLDFQQIIIRG